MTIQEIQSAIDAKVDARQIINMIADYIQANPGGGGGLTIYTGDGNISTTREVGVFGLLEFFARANESDITGVQLYMNGLGDPSIYIRGAIDDVTQNYLFAWYIEACKFVDSRVAKVGIEYDGDYSASFIDRSLVDKGYVDSKTNVVASDFANDGAAAVGGIAVGGLYHTSGTLKLRLS